eukprot:223730-Rhodomonas_salina.2
MAQDIMISDGTLPQAQGVSWKLDISLDLSRVCMAGHSYCPKAESTPPLPTHNDQCGKSNR